MCEQITIYSVPGPNSSPGILQGSIAGGWAYIFENLNYLTELNSDCNFQVVLGHVREFGPIPTLPSLARIQIEIYETSLKELSQEKNLAPAEQHGAILNFILASHDLETPYYAILDPDCYLVKVNAFHLLIKHMSHLDLGMIGVSYPTTLPKVYYWDFPTAYFQLMRTESCDPRHLDFLPEHTAFASGLGLKSKNRIPMAKTISFGVKILRFSKFPFKKWISTFQNSSNAFMQFLFYFTRNYIYRHSQLFRDTGWINRERLKNLDVEIIPHRIARMKLKMRFNQSEYTRVNGDVFGSDLNPTWHALMHGLYENRELGKQSFFWSVLSRMLKGTSLEPKKFPATSMIMADSFLVRIGMPTGWGNMLYGFEYFWKGEPFCIHLGHGGKENARSDISRLATIRKQIVGSDEIWSKNEFI